MGLTMRTITLAVALLVTLAAGCSNSTPSGPSERKLEGNRIPTRPTAPAQP